MQQRLFTELLGCYEFVNEIRCFIFKNYLFTRLSIEITDYLLCFPLKKGEMFFVPYVLLDKVCLLDGTDNCRYNCLSVIC